VTGRGRPSRLLHLGNVVIDVVMTVPALPERGGDVLASATTATPGGGFNVMAAAVRQGLPVAYAGARGSGPFAELAAAALAAEGIEVLQPPRPGLDTGVVISLVDAEGERTFVTGPGAEARLTAGDLVRVRAEPADAVYLSGYGLLHPSNRAALLSWLAALNETSPVFFDPGPLAAQIPPSAWAAAAGRANWLSCNAREAAILTGHEDAARAARVLARRPTVIAEDRGSPATQIHHADEIPGPAGGVVVRTGPEGCLIVPPGAAEPVRVPGFPVDAVDTNGAGDTHAGVFIAALAHGADPLEAARRANAAAALSVTRPGPATAPTAAELAEFLGAGLP
jgi:sugar/nucleoside kinase (ribokinase family)